MTNLGGRADKQVALLIHSRLERPLDDLLGSTVVVRSVNVRIGQVDVSEILIPTTMDEAVRHDIAQRDAVCELT